MRPQVDNSKFLIWVVDDDPAVCKALNRLMRSCGFKVRTFASGEELLCARELEQADCFVVDIHLSGISGFELHHRLGHRRVTLPVIFMTAHDDESSREKALTMGAIAYLHKPFEDAAIIAAIHKAVAG